MMMDFSAQIILENERTQLRLLRKKDTEQLFMIANDPEIWRFTTTSVNNKASMRRFVETAILEQKNEERYPFLVIDKANDHRVAGCMSFLNYSDRHRRIEIGHSWLGRAFQGSGLNSSCKFLLMQYAFEELKLHRVEFKTDVINQQSRSALLKLGATEEGILRSHTLMHDDRRRDTIYYSILQPEWQGIKRRVFQELAYR